MKELNVLVISENDTAAGPMAAAFLRDYSLHIHAVSAGIHPATQLHPLTQEVMRECLINMDDIVPCSVNALDRNNFDVILTLDEVDWGDCKPVTIIPIAVVPHEATITGFRMMRDWLKNKTYILFRDALRELMRCK